MNPRPRIALIHATTASVAPAVTALAEGFPAAEPWNLLDDKLLGDADAAGGLNPALEQRMHRLIAHAVAGGADAVQLTCSLYGPVAAGTRAAVPVLAPDQAAFDALADGGYETILVVASFETAQRDAQRRLGEFLGDQVSLPGVVAEGAFAAAKAGDTDRLAASLSAAVRGTTAEAVFLAQYSLAPAAEAVAVAAGVPVVTGPARAATALRELLGG